MAFAQGASLLLQFGGSVVLARYLTAYEMGVYAVAAATAGLLALIQSFGLQALIVREEMLDKEIIRTAFTVNIFVVIFLSIIIVLISYWGSWLLHDNKIRQVLLVLAIMPIFGIFDLLPTSQLERAGRFRDLSVASTANAVIVALTSSILALNGLSYMSIAYANILGAATGSLMVNFLGRSYVDYRIGFSSWRKITRFGLQMLAINGVQNVSIRLSDIILARLQGLALLGLFNRSINLNNLLWNNIHLITGRVMLVEFSNIRREGVSLRESYIRTVDMITAILWPAFTGLAILSGPFVLNVYGAKWLPACKPFTLLALGSVINVSITMTWELFAATGQLSKQTKIESGRAVLSLLTFTVGCSISLTAAAAARTLDAIFAVMIYRPHLNRMTNTSTMDFISIYFRNGCLTMLAVSPSFALMVSYGMSPYTPLDLVLASIAGGICLWTLGLMISGHGLAGEVIKFSRSLQATRRYLPPIS